MQGGRNPFGFGHPFGGFNGFGDPFGNSNPFGDPFGNSNPFGDPFGNFNGLGDPFGGQRSLMSSFFGARNPFDNPFFARPFGNMSSESNFFGSARGPFMNPNTSAFLENQPSRGPIIEELNSDDEKDENEEKKTNPKKHGRSSIEPFVEDPDEESAEKKSRTNDLNLMQHHGRALPQTRGFTFQSSSVTYGGANGAYYTSSSTRRSGSDGLTFEERKEANSATGQATHLVARGIHDKGHSVTRKLQSDGHVDTMQTLHNLNEDEVYGFDESWKGKARMHLPGASRDVIGNNPQRPNMGGWALPSTERLYNVGSSRPAIGRGEAASVPFRRSKFDSRGTGSSNQVNRR